MGSTTARIYTLITTFPHLHRHTTTSFLLFRRHLASTFHTHSHSNSPRLHSNSISSTTTAAAVPIPWPEWSNFVDRVSGLGFGCRNEVHVDEFVAPSRLSDGFLNVALAFLAFARHHPQLLWSLPREDLQAIIENVSPSLFKDADATTLRMRSFLAGQATHALESDKPTTVDLMKFLLSYVNMTTVSSEELYISSKVESSVRKLFSELVKSRGTFAESVASLQTQSPEGFRSAPRSSENNIEMKRGDWICTRCSFMNYAKNKSCLQCDDLRPKKILSGGEWECPQCNFFNFSRNVVCLRCDCKKPDLNSLQGNVSSVESNTRKALPESEGKHPPWLTKITQLEKSTDVNTDVSDEDLSKFMPAVDNRASSSNLNADINQNLGKNPLVMSKKKDRSLTSPVHKRRAAIGLASGTTNHVPFVPFPPDYFAQSSPNPTPANSTSNVTVERNQHKPPDSPEPGKTGEKGHKPNIFYEASQNIGQKGQFSSEMTWRGRSLEGSSVKEEPDPLDMSEEAKAERWFKRVAQIKDISELTQIPDEDFPSIMPLRKGVNRFVVSKRKTPLERRLTSSRYRRDLPVVESEPIRDSNETDSG